MGPRARSGSPSMVDLVLWSLSGAVLVAILALSLVREPAFAPDFDHADKLWHAAAYLVFTGSLLLAAVWRPGRGPGPVPGAAPWILLAIVAFGGTVELAQGALDRDPDVLDFVANAGGSGIAYVVWRISRARGRVTGTTRAEA